jgi:hypothetical protein
MSEKIDRRGMLAARFFYPLVSAARQVTKWHHVDSEVASRIVTYCGREMALKLWGGRIAYAAKGDQVNDANTCHDCMTAIRKKRA